MVKYLIVESTMSLSLTEKSIFCLQQSLKCYLHFLTIVAYYFQEQATVLKPFTIHESILSSLGMLSARTGSQEIDYLLICLCRFARPFPEKPGPAQLALIPDPLIRAQYQTERNRAVGGYPLRPTGTRRRRYPVPGSCLALKPYLKNINHEQPIQTNDLREFAHFQAECQGNATRR